jgi:hypothetical protein
MSTKENQYGGKSVREGEINRTEVRELQDNCKIKRHGTKRMGGQARWGGRKKQMTAARRDKNGSKNKRLDATEDVLIRACVWRVVASTWPCGVLVPIHPSPSTCGLTSARIKPSE